MRDTINEKQKLMEERENTNETMLTSSVGPASNNEFPPLAIDNDYFRLKLPIYRDGAIKPGMFFSAMKDLIGKDLSTVSMPVFINEPLSGLQKTGEMMCFCDDYFQKAIKEDNSVKRMLHMACYNMATFFLVKGRNGKPFNPLLGETFELVTDNIRFIAE